MKKKGRKKNSSFSYKNPDKAFSDLSKRKDKRLGRSDLTKISDLPSFSQNPEYLQAQELVKDVDSSENSIFALQLVLIKAYDKQLYIKFLFALTAYLFLPRKGIGKSKLSGAQFLSINRIYSVNFAKLKNENECFGLAELIKNIFMWDPIEKTSYLKRYRDVIKSSPLNTKQNNMEVALDNLVNAVEFSDGNLSKLIKILSSFLFPIEGYFVENFLMEKRIRSEEYADYISDLYTIYLDLPLRSDIVLKLEANFRNFLTNRKYY